MRLQKEITVGDKKIVVFELTVKQIRTLWSELTGATPEAGAVVTGETNFLRKHWDICVHGIKAEDVEEMTPSELQLIYDAFAEVNKVFFDLALKVEGEHPMLVAFREAVVKDLINQLANLSAKATPEPGTTDTASSLPPSK